MFASTHHRLLLTLAAARLAGGCAHGLNLPRAVGSCGTAGEVYVTSSKDDGGHQILIERILPARLNCEDILRTRLSYDARGTLARRVDEHLRCGVVEESVVTSREARGWLVERARDLDHDDRMDERSVVVVPAASFEPLALEDTGIACAIAQGDSQQGNYLTFSGARSG